MFLMWLGEQITSRGIGNGVSLIIMAGIVAHLPTTLVNLLEGGRSGSLDPLRLIGIVVAVVGAGPVHLLHGARAAPHPDPISQARRRSAGCRPIAATCRSRSTPRA